MNIGDFGTLLELLRFGVLVNINKMYLYYGVSMRLWDPGVKSYGSKVVHLSQVDKDRTSDS